MLRNKKGIETGLTDFYSTILIFLIILVFFFVLQIKTEKMQYSITGEELALDATQIALVYAQSPVETSLGDMTFTNFMQHAIGSQEREEELVSLTNTYFQKIQKETAVTLAVVEEEQTRVILEPMPGLIQFMSQGKTYSAPSHLLIPLQKPGDYVRIEIQTIRSS